jgi:predicted PurR-regulated permease PerM
MSDNDSRPESTASRRWPDRHLWEIQPVRDVGLIAIIIGIVSLGQALSVVTVPLLLALLFAYLLEPVVRRLVKIPHISRPGAAVILIIVIAVAVIAPLLVGLVFGIVQAIELIGRIPDLIQHAADAIAPLVGGNQEQIDATIADIKSWFEGNIGWIAQGAAARGVGVAEYVFSLISSTISFGLFLFLVPFFFFFFSTSYQSVLDFGRQLIPAKHRDHTIELISRMDAIVAAFIRGQLVIAVVLGIVHAIGWFIVGVPAAILLGLVAGVLSLVPYVIGITLPVAIGLLWFDQRAAEEPMAIWWIIGGPLIVYVVAQVLEGYVLQPLVHGKSTNLDAATIVAAVIAFASIAGVYGALIAIPLTACLKIVLTDIVWPRVQDWLEGRAEDPLPIGRRDAPK